MSLHVLKLIVQQPLLQHNYRSCRDDMFGLAGADGMVYLPSSADCGQQKIIVAYLGSWLLSGIPSCLIFLGGICSQVAC